MLAPLVRCAVLLAGLASLLPAPSAAQEACYGLMSFPSTPTEEQVQAYAARGVEILSFLQEDLYRVRVARCRRGRPAAESVSRFIGLRPEDRVDEEVWSLRLGAAPDRVADGPLPVRDPEGMLNLTVTFHDSVPPEKTASVLTRHTLEHRQISATRWVVRIMPAALESLASEQVVQWIANVPPPRRPDNDRTRTLLGVDDVQQFDLSAGGAAGLAGRGIRVGIFDFGIDEGHSDVGARVVENEMDPDPHGTHVAGIVAGEGRVTDGVDLNGAAITGQSFQWRGMAPLAELLDLNAQDGDTAVAYERPIRAGMLVSNHSYSVTDDGEYDEYTEMRDALIRGDERVSTGADPLPARLQVYSAGNRGERAPRPARQTGYFALTKQMKNALVVGNVHLQDGRIVTSVSSSLGPTHDGRIKPDLVAPGTNINSTGFCRVFDPEDDCPGAPSGATTRTNYYRPMSGTSMAAPAVTGILALVLEQYEQTYGGNVTAAPPPPATLRAILIQTAADVEGPVMRDISDGPVQAFPGPDFVTGWGLVRAPEAVALVQRQEIVEDSLAGVCDSVAVEFDVTADGALRVTLAWDDVAADGSITDRLTPRLVNDLDLVLVDPAGTRHRPWLLDHVAVDDQQNPIPDDQQQCRQPLTLRRSALPAPVGASAPDPLKNSLRPAGRGRDHLNNVEQVLVANPASGRWRAWVIGFNVRQGPQSFSLVGIRAVP